MEEEKLVRFFTVTAGVVRTWGAGGSTSWSLRALVAAHDEGHARRIVEIYFHIPAHGAQMAEGGWQMQISVSGYSSTVKKAIPGVCAYDEFAADNRPRVKE